MKFIEYRKIWFGISGVFIILGMIFLAFNGLNLGIDFAGGTIININYIKHLKYLKLGKLLILLIRQQI